MKNNYKYKIIFGIKIAFGITFFVLLFGFGTMYLWNWLVPLLFKGPVITFWQTLGLLLLSKILFSGFGKGGGRGWGRHRHEWKERMKERFSNMSPEEKEIFKRRLKEKCGGPFWRNWEEPEQVNKQNSEHIQNQ